MSDGTDHGLGPRLRAARKAAGFTQTELGDATHKGRSYIAQLERGGVTNPGAYTFYAIATTLGIRMEELMGVPRVETTTRGRSRARAEAKRATNDE